MKKIIKVVIVLFMLNACEKRNDRFYFDNFDEVEFYHKNISENEIFVEYDKMKYENYDTTYLRIVQDEYPIDLKNNTFTNELLKYGYNKKFIEKSKKSQIIEIFSKKVCGEITTNGCIPLYRDILIFKNKAKIVGIAKICFQCRISYIIGSKQNWDNFGECGDYKKLQQILKLRSH